MNTTRKKSEFHILRIIGVVFLNLFLFNILVNAQSPKNKVSSIGASDEYKNIWGIVRDESGNPLKDVSVKLTSGNEKTTTNKNGVYSLSAPINSSVIYSSNGYKSEVKTITIDSKQIDVKLQKGDEKQTLDPKRPGTCCQENHCENNLDSQKIFTVEEPPHFPGGEEKMKEFISVNLKYPEAAKKQGLKGRVILSFSIETDGSIQNIEVIRGINPSLDKAAIKVVESMPKWVPGKEKSKSVKTRYTLPIDFK
ncbi:MAG: TonB family protein [Bacteroidales bacterium]